jgi:hypothetical protein
MKANLFLYPKLMTQLDTPISQFSYALAMQLTCDLRDLYQNAVVFRPSAEIVI